MSRFKIVIIISLIISGVMLGIDFVFGLRLSWQSMLFLYIIILICAINTVYGGTDNNTTYKVDRPSGMRDDGTYWAGYGYELQEKQKKANEAIIEQNERAKKEESRKIK